MFIREPKFEVKSLYYEWYGITGETISIKFPKGFRSILELNDIWLPARVINEYEKFIQVEVLPHNNPAGWDISKPYLISLNKMNIIFGEVLIMRRGIIINDVDEEIQIQSDCV